MTNVRAALIAVAACIAGAFPSQAQNTGSAPKREACFFSSQFVGWRAPDDKTIFIRVGLTRYYRLDLSARCPGLIWPGAILINRIEGSDLICRPLDWNIIVTQLPGGFEQRCLVGSMTLLNPEEVASIPKRFKP